MYEFLDRLINVALPRVRDFRGVSRRSFDGRGNYNMGVKEQIIFPEIDFDQVDAIRGMDIAITTTARNGRPRSRVARGVQVPAEERSLMAKKSMLMRQKHREVAVKKYAKKRAELKELIRDPKTGTRTRSRRRRRCRRCRATRTRFGCATAAR